MHVCDAMTMLGYNDTPHPLEELLLIHVISCPHRNG